MNPEIKSKWVATLRSGEYKQTIGALRTPEGFCCLGVLCDLHAKETGTQWNGFAYQHEKMLLPDSVKDWAGVGRSPEVSLEGDSEESELSAFNDDGNTFSRIADLIEAQL